MEHSVQRDTGGKTLTIQTGKLATLADAAVTLRYGDDVLLVTACVSPEPRQGMDFLPLTVDYEERHYAVGKIPGSFFRREGRPTQEAILFGRLADRPIRPLFPKGFYNEVQIIITVLSVDQENPPELLGVIGASAALAISQIPFEGPVGACRIAHKDGSFLVNPTYGEISKGDLAVVVAGTRDAVMMVEAGAEEVSEEVVLEAIRLGQEANGQIIDMIDELVSIVGKPKMTVDIDTTTDIEDEVSNILGDKLVRALEAGLDKAEREGTLKALQAEVQEKLAEQHPQDKVAAAFKAITEGAARSMILDKGVRPDGREPAQIRPITCEVGLLPRTHGSGLFQRGQTQALTIATLASVGMKQALDTLSPEESRRFMHHYNFPPFTVGEVKRVGSPSRRSIGHGALAERALEPTIPSEEEFPYAIRLVSEVLSSNGSTSMASVCGSTLALMDAGVPLKRPVAGVAMGLIMGENGQYSILTDIQGMEDHVGDMDFKVAGTERGINTLQMDIKVKGITPEIMGKALAQAKEGRLFILDKMLQVISEPRSHLSPYAPRLVRIMIPVDKIGSIIGPGGRVIRAMQEETGTTIDVEDDGTVIIGGSDEAKIKSARDRIDGLTREIAVGDVFTGKVVRLTSFGAFVELLPGKDGLLRSTEMGDLGEVEMGQEVTLMVQEIDALGRINLSRRAMTGGPAGDDGRNGPPRPPQRGFSRGGPGGQGGSGYGSRGPGQRSGYRPPGEGGSQQGSRPPFRKFSK